MCRWWCVRGRQEEELHHHLHDERIFLMNDDECDGMKHTSAHVHDDGVQVEEEKFFFKNRSIVWDYFGMYNCSPEYTEHATVKLMRKFGLHHLPLGEKNVKYKMFPLVSVQVWHREPGNMHP